MLCLCLALCLGPDLFELISRHCTAIQDYGWLPLTQSRKRNGNSNSEPSGEEPEPQEKVLRVCLCKPPPPRHAYDVLPISIAHTMFCPFPLQKHYYSEQTADSQTELLWFYLRVFVEA
jgi:hypothetical protein